MKVGQATVHRQSLQGGEAIVQVHSLKVGQAIVQVQSPKGRHSTDVAPYGRGMRLLKGIVLRPK